MKPQDIALLALVLWREARGEVLLVTKQAVAWSIRNRVNHPGWWGRSWWTVILMPFQYSSFNHNDPNATKWPMETDESWLECVAVAADIGSDTPSISDPTNGATSYFDMSMDINPPKWATDGSNEKICDYGRIHFYRLATSHP